MAKIFFVGLDGTEKSYRLQTHRPFTVGRDPGNDIILRDPKVSRHHAEVVFERGFFVLHDLSSANGTYVNGKRVRVAPLTHGARLRLGNTYGRFSEELPTEADAAPSSALEAPFEPTIIPPTEDLSFEIMPTSQHERVNVNVQTLPHEKLGEADLKKSGVVALAEADELEGPTEPLPPPREPQSPRATPAPAAPSIAATFSKNRYRFTSGLRAGELARVRDEDGIPVLTYRSFASVVGIVAALVCGIVFVAGLAATTFLFEEEAPLRAIAVLALTVVFTLGIAMLVPRIQVTLYDADQPSLTISQNFVFPTASYVIATASGTTLATLRRSAFSRLGRNQWTIFADGHRMGHAAEESLSRSFTRKLLGKFNRRFDANVRIEYSGLDAGTIIRRGADADTLELRGDLLDRRVAIALATLILGSEP